MPWGKSLLARPKRPGPCILTPEQFAFMHSHHELVELALMDQKRGDHTALQEFLALDEYRQVFGDMGWDDVYDRYQDTPGYDGSLRLALHQQLHEDLDSGRFVIPENRGSPRWKIHSRPVDPHIPPFEPDLTLFPRDLKRQCRMLRKLRKFFDKHNASIK